MTRKRLPARRGGFNLDFVCGSTAFTALLSFDEQNDLKEVFLRAGKIGTDVNIVMTEAALLLSFLLQYGGKIEEVKTAMPRTAEGRPEGPIGTLLDLLAKEWAADAKKDLLS